MPDKIPQGAAPPSAPGSERGEPSVMVNGTDTCPRCASPVLAGYGLMYGGIGVYKCCTSHACDWFWKREDAE